ncbi:transcription elongation factor GreA [Caproicibacterium sp. NSD3]
MIKQTVLTQEGLDKLEKELEQLKGVKRKEVAEKIKVALSFGDLSENSEYDEAKNEQAIMEARIADLEVTLKNVKVIDESELSNGLVHVGSKVQVSVKDEKTQKVREMNLKIVGSNETDPVQGFISDESAVGKALLGHAVNDVMQIEVPAGIKEYTILSISK